MVWARIVAIDGGLWRNSESRALSWNCHRWWNNNLAYVFDVFFFVWLVFLLALFILISFLVSNMNDLLDQYIARTFLLFLLTGLGRQRLWHPPWAHDQPTHLQQSVWKGTSRVSTNLINKWGMISSSSGTGKDNQDWVNDLCNCLQIVNKNSVKIGSRQLKIFKMKDISRGEPSFSWLQMQLLRTIFSSSSLPRLGDLSYFSSFWILGNQQVFSLVDQQEIV